MATRSKLLSVSTGLFHCFTSGHPHVPLIPIQRFSSDASTVDKKDGNGVVNTNPGDDTDLNNAFVHTAATVFASTHEEARQMIYKTETKKYRGFHIYCSKDIAKKFAELPEVYQVLPDFETVKSESQVPKE